MPDPKAVVNIGLPVTNGDRLVGAGCEDASGNYSIPLVDADGHLQIDVLSGGGSATEYADGAARGTATGTLIMGDDGTNIQSVKVDSAGELQIDVLSIAAGNNNIGDVDIASGTLTTVTTVSTVTALTGGGVAHDGVDSGNPHKIGFIAKSPDGTTPGVVAENDRTDAKADLNGRQFVNTRSPQSLHAHLDGTAAYTDQSVIADPGDGFQAVITSITFSSGEAVAINFFLEEGSTKIFGPIYIEAVAGRGFTASNLHIPCTASTAVLLTTSAANDQSFDMDYFIQAV